MDRLYDILIEHGLPWWAVIAIVFVAATVKPAFDLTVAILRRGHLIERPPVPATAAQLAKERRQLAHEQRLFVDRISRRLDDSERAVATALEAVKDCHESHADCRRKTDELQERIAHLERFHDGRVAS
jgi:hypothetical protein